MGTAILLKYIGATIIVFGAFFFGMSEHVDATEISLETIGSQTPNAHIFTTQDHRLQLSSSGDTYSFVALESMDLCTDYCGITFNMLGLGFGGNVQFMRLTFYGQLGAYYIRPTENEWNSNENLYYYFKQFGDISNVKRYSINNSNGIGGQVGAKFSLSKHSYIKFGYRLLQFYINPRLDFTGGGYWHAPATLRFSGFVVGYGLKW